MVWRGLCVPPGSRTRRSVKVRDRCPPRWPPASIGMRSFCRKRRSRGRRDVRDSLRKRRRNPFRRSALAPGRPWAPDGEPDTTRMGTVSSWSVRRDREPGQGWPYAPGEIWPQDRLRLSIELFGPLPWTRMRQALIWLCDRYGVLRVSAVGQAGLPRLPLPGQCASAQPAAKLRGQLL